MTVTTKEAIKTMCNWNEVFEERGLIRGREEGREEAHEESALRMLADGKLSLDEIASYTDLPIERVRELASKTPA